MKLDDNLNFQTTGVNFMNTNTGSFFTTDGNPSQDGNTTQTLSCWGYWRDYYYPQYYSYPVYIQERAKDKGKQAFEIIKMLKDKRFLKLETVGEFIDVMDELIKIL